MPAYRPISFNEPYLAPDTARFFRQAYRNQQTSGNGPFGRRCEALLAQESGASGVLLTTSCTHALEMAAILLDLKPGDEVILPSFTFVSTANAFVLRGARPVFVDIRPDTLNLDEQQVEDAVTVRTRAIIVVHYAGVACELEPILAIARRHRIAVVEDNAHGLFGTYRGRPLGGFGRFAALSFHETKNLACGEGGALVLNQPGDLAAAEVVRDKGTDRARFLRGTVEKYTWQSLGSSYVQSDLLAAVLFAQLAQRQAIQAKRRRIWEFYQQGLKDWAARTGAALPVVPVHCGPSYHLFHVVMATPRQRDGLLKHLDRHRIQAVFHYVPLHLSPAGRSRAGRRRRLPHTESIAGRLLRLPFFTNLRAGDLDRVVSTVATFRP